MKIPYVLNYGNGAYYGFTVFAGSRDIDELMKSLSSIRYKGYSINEQHKANNYNSATKEDVENVRQLLCDSGFVVEDECYDMNNEYIAECLGVEFNPDKYEYDKEIDNEEETFNR